MTQVFAAQNRIEYERAKREAKIQEKSTNDLYIAYHAKAKEVERLWREAGSEVPPRNTAEHKVYTKALAVKKEAEIAWQRAAHKHGAMFVDLKPVVREAPEEETVW